MNEKDFVGNFTSSIFWSIKLPEFKWTYLSPSIEKLRGFSVDEAKKQSLEEVLTAESYKIVERKLTNELAPESNEKDRQSLELEHFCKNGETKWFLVEIKVVRNLTGIPVEISGISTDIDEYKKKFENQRKKIQQLQKISEKLERLKDLLPICASCKKIRKDNGDWEQIESYIRKNYSIDFSHGICPDCCKRLYPEDYMEIYGKNKS